MADTNKPDTRAGFDAAAVDFTALGRHLWHPIGEATVALAGPRTGDRVLDACCGTGASALPAAQLVGPGGAVDAVDMSGPMVGELRRFAAGIPQLTAHQADVTTWPGDGYDVVLCVLGIFFFPDMTAGTEHLVRRARPGGRVALTIWRAGAMDLAGRHLRRAVAAATGGEPAGERPRSLYDDINRPEPYADWLAGRGLSDVDVAVHELALPMTPEIAWLVVTGSGYRGALTKLDDATVADVRERYLASLHEDGITELDATTLIGTGRPGSTGASPTAVH